MVQEVFILDLRRRDGSRFITSVSDRESTRPAAARHHAESTTVSHWRRDGEKVRTHDFGSTLDWRLNERYAL